MADDNAQELTYIQGLSVRDLVEKVNSVNFVSNESPILKENIVGIVKEGDSFFLVYYK